MEPTTPTITVTPTDVYNPLGLAPGDTTKGYLRFYLPLVGPTGVLAYQYLLESTGWGEHAAVIDLATMAGDLGLGRKLSKVELSLGRMARFRLLIAERPGPELLIPTALRPLTDSQLDQLRPELQRIERIYRTGHPAALPLPLG